MASRNQPISSMNPMQHRDTTIKVRVVRLWCVPPYSSNTSKPNTGVVAIQMVLCDSKNCTIGVSVPSMYLNKFKGALVEGGVYFISRFGVGGSGGNFRITTHAFKINFQFGTRVIPTVDDPNIHKFGFDWVTAESITSGNANEKTLSSKDDASSKRVTIEIEDRARSRVSATLWGRYCDQIEKFMNKHKEGPVVIALQYCKIKVFNGHRSLSNSMHATRVLINEDLEDFRGFHDKDSGSNLKSPLRGNESIHCIIGSVLKVDDDSMQSLAKFEKFLGIRFVFKVGVKLATWSPTPLLTVHAMSWDQDLIKKLSADSPLDVVATEQFGDTNICSSNSQDVTGGDVSSQNLTPNVEVVKNNLDNETANPRYAIEGCSLSFSEEVTSEDRVTTSSSMGNSSEDSNTKRRAYDFNEVNTVSLDVLKKVKLEKL
ncbi:replication protein A 70 kDa DNA-binding subunit C-like [Senna tora]|uniref:Replication protein A 70 kDa DNA-binding subunit C-like n=1 Tax=Senna tora TaxID=362788 RepID=A0A834X0D6_9FABA|nr:replication protein A 70 kDa DNA-binding subunit C-like [Senna tora]